jgi:hypothetical protein
MSGYKNGEGYSDPTAGAALARIRKQERNRRRKEIRRHLYLLKQLAGGENNGSVERTGERGNCSGGEGLPQCESGTSTKAEKPRGEGDD